MRSWIVIPAMGAVTAVVAVGLGLSPVVGLAGASLAAVARALAGSGPAALVGAALAPLVAIATFGATGGCAPRAAVAIGAAGWAVTELTREREAAPGPLVAALAASIAAILDPSFAALVAVVGLWLGSASRRPPWAPAVLVAGALAIALAALAGTAWPALGDAWFATPAQPVAPTALAALAGEALGPITAVAALAGLAALARPRSAELAIAATVAGGALVDLRAGALGPASIAVASLLAALAVARLAAQIRLASGQAITAATIGALVIVPPAWGAVGARASVAHTGHASR